MCDLDDSDDEELVIEHPDPQRRSQRIQHQPRPTTRQSGSGSNQQQPSYQENPTRQPQSSRRNARVGQAAVSQPPPAQSPRRRNRTSQAPTQQYDRNRGHAPGSEQIRRTPQPPAPRPRVPSRERRQPLPPRQIGEYRARRSRNDPPACPDCLHTGALPCVCQTYHPRYRPSCGRCGGYEEYPCPTCVGRGHM